MTGVSGSGISSQGRSLVYWIATLYVALESAVAMDVFRLPELLRENPRPLEGVRCRCLASPALFSA
jgi:hypothetical protein